MSKKKSKEWPATLKPDDEFVRQANQDYRRVAEYLFEWAMRDKPGLIRKEKTK